MKLELRHASNRSFSCEEGVEGLLAQRVRGIGGVVECSGRLRCTIINTVVCVQKGTVEAAKQKGQEPMGAV